jgi:ABC-type multidrug transport system permease subunit
MSDDAQYAPPPSGFDSQPPRNPETITESMIDYLNQTKPWVRFLSVLLFIAIGLMILGSLVGMVASLAASSGRQAEMMIPLFLLYFALGFLYLPPAMFLWKYASAIQSISLDKVTGMEQALRYQKSFWKFMGILAIVILVLYVIAIVIFIVMGAFSYSYNRY